MAHAKKGMETSFVNDFKKLRVLAPYDFLKMEDLMEDLTAALEDSAQTQRVKDQKGHYRQKYKRKSKKRKSIAVVNTGNMSETSESSLEEALKDYVEKIVNNSDSDDILHITKLKNVLGHANNHSVSIAESDSFTENFSPMRPGRRRRRFKRMAVDPQPELEIPITEYLNEQRMKRLSAVRPKVKQQEQLNNSNSMDSESTLERNPNRECCEMKNFFTQSSTDTLTGKRKRGVKNGGSVDALDEDSATSTDKSGVMESNSSSISSSESDYLLTNDEGQEGDDEHSDFFHEPGPACGIPGIIPWWENVDTGDGDGTNLARRQRDAKFDAILRGSFEHMSEESKSNFKARLTLLAKSGREVKMGRRRLPHKTPQYSLAKFIQDRQQWQQDNASPKARGGSCLSSNCCAVRLNTSHSQQSLSNSSQSGDTKRRRKTPPATPTAELVGAEAEPIPDSNIGNRMLQSMGWTPGTGLGSQGHGITTPIMASRRPGRKGLGHGTGSTNIS